MKIQLLSDIKWSNHETLVADDSMLRTATLLYRGQVASVWQWNIDGRIEYDAYVVADDEKGTGERVFVGDPLEFLSWILTEGVETYDEDQD